MLRLITLLLTYFISNSLNRKIRNAKKKIDKTLDLYLRACPGFGTKGFEIVPSGLDSKYYLKFKDKCVTIRQPNGDKTVVYL